MKKLLAIFGTVLGILLLAGCGSQPSAVTPPTNQTTSTGTPSTAPADSAQVPQDSAVANLPSVPTITAPAKTTDVDASLNQINSDLNALDKNIPDTTSLDNTNLQK